MALHDAGKLACNRASAGAVLAEKMRLLRDTCCDKYLLLPAIFFFLWQVRKWNSMSHFLSYHACKSFSVHIKHSVPVIHNEEHFCTEYLASACEVTVLYRSCHQICNVSITVLLQVCMLHGARLSRAYDWFTHADHPVCGLSNVLLQHQRTPFL